MAEQIKKPLSYAEALGQALMPAVPNFAPGAEYSDESRLFQGIPSIEWAPGGRLWATWYGGGQGESPLNYVMLATSADDGKNWGLFKGKDDPAEPLVFTGI